MCLCFYNSLCHNLLLTAQAFAALNVLQDVLCLHLFSSSFPCFGSSRDTTYWVSNWLLQYPRTVRQSSGMTIPYSPNGLPVRFCKAFGTAAANIPYLLWYLAPPKKRATLIRRLITNVSEHMKKLPWKTYLLGQSRLGAGNTTCRGTWVGFLLWKGLQTVI